MARGAWEFQGPQLYILSGRDHVCAEFVDFAAAHARWSALWQRAGVDRLILPTADHTFSSHELRVDVENAVLAFLNNLSTRGHA
jgi:pantothenate kinase-related protein Tda10